MNDQVRKIFSEQIWNIATCGEEPNVVPVGYKAVLDDGRLAACAVFLDRTLQNVRKNDKVAVSAYAMPSLEGYQIKGTAEIVTEGEEFEQMKAMVRGINEKATVKAVLLINPETVIISTPGPDNNQEI